jgi:hypothetical protein
VLDILWQKADNQQIVLWHMNTAGVRIGNAVVLPVGGVGQYVAHWQWEFSAGAVHNDENGDGRADILWQHSSTGQVVSWRMNGAWGRGSFATLASRAGSTERVVAQADFNGDGINDLLWSVKSGGQTRAVVWYRNAAGARTSYAVLGSVPEVYELVGAGDMNRDGNTDLLWQHSGTGQLVAWHYNGAGVRLSHAVLVASMSGYRVHAVGDMNGDGNADLIWQGVSGSNATTIIWYMNGAGGAAVSGPWQRFRMPGPWEPWVTTTAMGTWTWCGRTLHRADRRLGTQCDPATLEPPHHRHRHGRLAG